MRLSLPHDVDAGVLKRVILADGAVVTVKGARSVSLRHPIELPLPLNQTHNGFASGFVTLAEHLRHASRKQVTPLHSSPSALLVLPHSLPLPHHHRRPLASLSSSVLPQALWVCHHHQKPKPLKPLISKEKPLPF